MEAEWLCWVQIYRIHEENYNKIRSYSYRYAHNTLARFCQIVFFGLCRTFQSNDRIQNSLQLIIRIAWQWIYNWPFHGRSYRYVHRLSQVVYFGLFRTFQSNDRIRNSLQLIIRIAWQMNLKLAISRQGPLQSTQQPLFAKRIVMLISICPFIFSKNKAILTHWNLERF